MENIIKKIKEDKKLFKILFLSLSALVFIVGVLFAVYLDSQRIVPGEANKNNSNVSSIGFVTEADDRVIISPIPATFNYSEISVAPEQGIISTDKNGNDVKIISREYGLYLTYTDGWLYYSNAFDSFKLYKIKPDGSEKQLVLDKTVDSLISDGEWLYYHNSNELKIERMNLKDNSKTEVIAENVYGTDINISGDRLYYLNGDTERYIASINKDGSDYKKLASIGDGYNLIVHDGYMYYIAGSNIKRIKINSTTSEDVLTGCEAAKFVIDDENIWYLSGASRYIYKYDRNKKTSTATSVGDCSELGFAFGKPYGMVYDFIIQVTDDGQKSYGRYSSLNG